MFVQQLQQHQNKTQTCTTALMHTAASSRPHKRSDHYLRQQHRSTVGRRCFSHDDHEFSTSTRVTTTTIAETTCHKAPQPHHSAVNNGRTSFNSMQPFAAPLVMCSPAVSALRPEPAHSHHSQLTLDSLAEDAIDWACQHKMACGLGPSAPPGAMIHAPLSLLPGAAFPKAEFAQVKSSQQLFNTLIDRVAADEPYLTCTLSKAAQQDHFTGRLLQLLQECAAAKAIAASHGHEEVVLGIHRSDFMFDQPSRRFLQVELNTISCGLVSLSTIATTYHRQVLQRLAALAEMTTVTALELTTEPDVSHDHQDDGSRADQQAALMMTAAEVVSSAQLPENEAMQNVAAAMAAAVQAAGGGDAVMVMVVQPGERNIYDQQWLQQTLWEEHGIPTVRLTLAEVTTALRQQPVDAAGSPGSPNKLVLASTGQTVGLVYFRAGYTPTDYPSETEWQARRLIETSTAAKCPTLAYQLAGCKKIQQDLARPGVVERFMGQQQGAELRKVFAGLWSLDDLSDPVTIATVKDAITNPDAYVLKPQREGGGNNLYGDELAQALKQGLAAASVSAESQSRPMRANSISAPAGKVAASVAAAAVMYSTFNDVMERDAGIQSHSGLQQSSSQQQQQEQQQQQQQPPEQQQLDKQQGLAAYILMQRILPASQRTVFVTHGSWREGEGLSELGVFGTHLRVGNKVLLNEEVGHLVRTKVASSNEGSFMTGVAVLDSPLLVEGGPGEPDDQQLSLPLSLLAVTKKMLLATVTTETTGSCNK